MRINEITIKNFRCLRNVKFHPKNVCLIIGENDAGKTSILQALRAIISNKFVLLPEDIYTKDPQLPPKDREPIEIEVIFYPDDPTKGFTDDESSIFFENFDLDNNNNERIILKLTYQWDDEREEFISKTFFQKKDGEGAEYTARFSRNLELLLVDANRDINREIGSRNGLWRKLLSTINISDDTQKEVLKTLSMADDKLQNDKEFKKVKDNFDGHITRLLGLQGNANIKLSPVAQESSEIIRDVNLYLRCYGSDVFIPIDRHGTGSQSIAVIALFRAWIDSKLIPNTFFAFEEPEAHLHPHVQRHIFKEIKELGNQIFVTTHSTFIADQADIHDIVLIRKRSSECITKQIPREDPFNKDTTFLPSDWEMTIKRYIEGNNSEIYFARCILLVEGDSEKYAIPIIAKALNVNFDALGISLIAVNSHDFNPFLRICSHVAFDIPWVILTDEDAKVSVANQIENTGYLQPGTIKKVKQNEVELTKLLDSNNCFILTGNFEKFLFNNGFLNEYIQAIEEIDGKDALKRYAEQRNRPSNGYKCKNCGYPIKNAESFSELSIEEQIIEYSKKTHKKPKYARKVMDIVTKDGADGSRIPKKFVDLLARVQTIAEKSIEMEYTSNEKDIKTPKKVIAAPLKNVKTNALAKTKV